MSSDEEDQTMTFDEFIKRRYSSFEQYFCAMANKFKNSNTESSELVQQAITECLASENQMLKLAVIVNSDGFKEVQKSFLNLLKVTGSQWDAIVSGVGNRFRKEYEWKIFTTKRIRWVALAIIRSPSHTRRRESELGDLVHEDVSPIESLILQDLANLLASGASEPGKGFGLTEEERNVLRLRYVYKLTRKQVAKELELTVDQVRTREENALAKLRRFFEDEPG